MADAGSLFIVATMVLSIVHELFVSEALLCIDAPGSQIFLNVMLMFSFSCCHNNVYPNLLDVNKIGFYRS